jgi:hypothetical protein
MRCSRARTRRARPHCSVPLSSALLGVAACLLGWSAHAASFVWDRVALGATDSIQWNQLGGASTTVAQPFTVGTTGNGWQVQVSKATDGLFERRDQGSGWNGNFAPGDSLLWTRGTAGPLSLTFAQPVDRVGMQIQKADQSNPIFTATIEAFDASNASLGAFQREGYSTSSGDNSAIFIGIANSIPNIARIEVSVLWDFDFAINQVSLIPEPPQSAAVTLAALLLLAACRRGSRRSRRPES